MKKIILLIILMLSSAYAWAASDATEAGYNVNVHVTASRVAVEVHQGFAFEFQVLNVVIDGKKYELHWKSPKSSPGVLALGDYKAKLVRDEHKNAYDSRQVYEFLLPDQKLRQFEVIGLSE